MGGRSFGGALNIWNLSIKFFIFVTVSVLTVEVVGEEEITICV